MTRQSKAISDELLEQAKVSLKELGRSGEAGRRLQAIISAKSKGIKVQDKGDEIISYSNVDSTQDEVRLMIDIAIAKNWNLLVIEIEL